MFWVYVFLFIYYIYKQNLFFLKKNYFQLGLVKLKSENEVEILLELLLLFGIKDLLPILRGLLSDDDGLNLTGPAVLVDDEGC